MNPNHGVQKISPALAAPVNYFEIAFNADAGVSYHLWVRLRAWNNKVSNDSIHVQFSDAVVPTNWQTLTTLPGTGSPALITDVATHSQRFYRVLAQ